MGNTTPIPSSSSSNPLHRHSQPSATSYRGVDALPPVYPPLHPRESPMGQSSSNQGQTSDSSYLSSHSAHTALQAPGVGGGGRDQEEDDDEEDEEDEKELRALGPASKYPDSADSRPSSARLTPQTGKVGSVWLLRGCYVGCT